MLSIAVEKETRNSGINPTGAIKEEEAEKKKFHRQNQKSNSHPPFWNTQT